MRIKQMKAATAVVLAALAIGVQAAPPAGVSEAAAMPDGGWLALGRNALHLYGADGGERAKLALRGRQLDSRPSPEGALAIVIDANAEQAVPVRVNSRQGSITADAALPAVGFGIEAACLYRDAQQLDHVFLIAKDGQAEQWLLSGKKPQRVRHLALPPHVKHCRVDDAAATLYVSENGFGVWAYGADAEGVDHRSAVALRAPYGKLAGGAGALATLPGGLAVLDAKGKALHSFRYRDGAWTGQPVRKLAAAASPRALALDGKGKLFMLSGDEERWQELALRWMPPAPAPQLPVVQPRAQTEPVSRAGDAADDPAIWLHATDPQASRVLGTNKKQGLLVYDLQGRQLQLLESGRLNNVDVRQNVELDGQRFDLAAATQRDENAIVLFTIDANGQVSEAARFPTGLREIYGACLYHPAGGALEIFVNDKDGSYQQYRVGRSGGQFTGTLLRRFSVSSQPEGCAADDRTGQLFVGEEKKGVWVTAASAEKATPLKMALPVGGLLKADVEGMSVYHGSQANYLVVSSQGNNSYIVMDSAPPFKVRGAFRIGFNVEAGIDGASETDGLDVTSANLGGAYGRGMLVVQDGFKRLPDGPQNFKYVAWDDIARALTLD